VAASAGGAKRGRKPKVAALEQPAFQLEPQPYQMGFDLSGGR